MNDRTRDLVARIDDIDLRKELRVELERQAFGQLERERIQAWIQQAANTLNVDGGLAEQYLIGAIYAASLVGLSDLCVWAQQCLTACSVIHRNTIAVRSRQMGRSLWGQLEALGPVYEPSEDERADFWRVFAQTRQP